MKQSVDNKTANNTSQRCKCAPEIAKSSNKCHFIDTSSVKIRQFSELNEDVESQEKKTDGLESESNSIDPTFLPTSAETFFLRFSQPKNKSRLKPWELQKNRGSYQYQYSKCASR